MVCYHFLVRLACVRHAASVDSEPGSNSRLKPDIDPPRRRSQWTRSCPRRFLAKGAAGTLPCENDQAKPDRISRLARSTNLSKILEGGPPGRDPWDRGPDLHPGCPRTWCASPIFSASSAASGVFARTFQSYQNHGAGSRKDFLRTKINNFGSESIASGRSPGSTTCSRCAKFSMSGQQKMPEPLGLAGDQLPGHAMACSLWDSLQGLNCAPTAHCVRPNERVPLP